MNKAANTKELIHKKDFLRLCLAMSLLKSQPKPKLRPAISNNKMIAPMISSPSVGELMAAAICILSLPSNVVLLGFSKSWLTLQVLNHFTSFPSALTVPVQGMLASSGFG
jgi:hypothetical protein